MYNKSPACCRTHSKSQYMRGMYRGVKHTRQNHAKPKKISRATQSINTLYLIFIIHWGRLRLTFYSWMNCCCIIHTRRLAPVTTPSPWAFYINDKNTSHFLRLGTSTDFHGTAAADRWPQWTHGCTDSVFTMHLFSLTPNKPYSLSTVTLRFIYTSTRCTDGTEVNVCTFMCMPLCEYIFSCTEIMSLGGLELICIM